MVVYLYNTKGNIRYSKQLDKRKIIYKGMIVGKIQCNNTFDVLKDKSCQPNIVYTAKLSFKNKK